MTMVSAIAGCLGDDNGDDEDDGDDDADDGDDDDGEDVDQNEQLAESMIESIEEDLTVEDWTLDDDQISIEFVTTGDTTDDVLAIASPYAGAVDGEFDVPLIGTALNDDGDTEYDLEIEVEWAQEFLDEDISDDEYINRIRGTTQ